MSKEAVYAPHLITDELAGWARSQMAACHASPASDPAAVREQLVRLEASSPHIFLFDFAAGSVSLRRKTIAHPDAGAGAELLRRARLYLALFRDVVARFALEYAFSLGIDVDDHPVGTSEVPLFAFQKLAGTPLILLPDIDILAADHFTSPDYEDLLTFPEKADAAIFVGATTGANLTREVVEALAMPRLRSAVFFRDTPDIVFRLPKIVQYDTEETAEMVRALDVSGAPSTWKEQFGYKYLLSMDGNGATCSRVAVALKSRSLLIKYASDFQLFYFEGLKSGDNFLSVSTDEEVAGVLDWCRSRPLQAAAIAEAGRRFAFSHLSRLPVLIYVAYLLEAYAQTMSDGGAGPPPFAVGASATFETYGHIQNTGDVRAGHDGWLGATGSELAIEGFSLEPAPWIDPFDVSYSAVFPDGGLSGRCFGYDFCGSRHQNRSLHGLAISLSGSAAKTYRLTYVAAFADGSLVGPVASGEICRSSQGAELTGLRLIMTPRADA